MFEIPGAKRVKRTEFFERDNDNEQRTLIDGQKKHSDVDVDETLPDYGFDYEFIDQTTTASTQQAETTSEKEQTFQFNLFRPAPQSSQKQSSALTPSTETTCQNTTGSVPALISIRSPSPAVSQEAERGLYHTSRPDSYYLTSCVPPEKQQRLRESYAAAAVTGNFILDTLSTRHWPGASLSWRVIHLPTNRKQVVLQKTPSLTKLPSSSTVKGTAMINNENPRTGRRPRPSKKRRDLLRDRAAKRQRIIDESKSKEEHEKEKRNKKNRERKLKRRAKERREKEEKKVGDTSQMSEDSSEKG
ncbi:hypothetical protein LTS08_002727 [Lithohypha guttulata]|nr:hypothetical protein LTS08_002727 [Lithohypha guttulata]